jgi:hypothetical protein
MISNEMVVLLFAIFSVKHFVIDFLCQNEYQWSHKHLYGHPGGILHSELHILGTLVTLMIFPFISGQDVMLLALCDGIIHYHIDYVKMNINNHFKLTSDKPEFWYMIGADQLLHYLTYCGIIWYIIS